MLCKGQLSNSLIVCSDNEICVDGVATFSCSCSPGFIGTNCTNNIDDCAGNPCKMVEFVMMKWLVSTASATLCSLGKPVKILMVCGWLFKKENSNSFCFPHLGWKQQMFVMRIAVVLTLTYQATNTGHFLNSCPICNHCIFSGHTVLVSDLGGVGVPSVYFPFNTDVGIVLMNQAKLTISGKVCKESHKRICIFDSCSIGEYSSSKCSMQFHHCVTCYVDSHEAKIY